MILTLESALFDQRACERTLGTLENAARARVLKRLLVASSAEKVIHFRADLLRLALLHFEGDTGDDAVVAAVNACAVAELEVVALDPADRAVRIDMRNAVDNVLHLAAVGSCVHKHRSADRTGNTPAELKTGKTALERVLAKRRKTCSGAAVDRVVVHERYPAEVSVKTDNGSAEAIVGSENVAAVAEDKVVDVGLAALLENSAELAESADLYVDVGVSADFEGGVPVEWFILARLAAEELCKVVNYIRSVHNSP